MKKLLLLISAAAIMLFAFGGCGMGEAASDAASGVGDAASDVASGAGDAVSDAVSEGESAADSMSDGRVTDGDGIIGNEDTNEDNSNNENNNTNSDATNLSEELM